VIETTRCIFTGGYILCYTSYMKQTDVDRFHAKYQVQENGCWLWQGMTRGAYGKFRVYDHGRTDVPAHRFSLEFLGSGLPKHMMVLHTCDLPLCVNPEHLYAGTAQDNARDSMERTYRLHPELRARGEDASNSKLTEEQVKEIHAAHIPYADLAAKYGVTCGTVSGIKSGKTWKHLNLGVKDRKYWERQRLLGERHKLEQDILWVNRQLSYLD